MKHAFDQKSVFNCIKNNAAFPHATFKYWLFQGAIFGTLLISYCSLLIYADALSEAIVSYLLAYGAVTVLTLSVGHQALHGVLFANRKACRALGVLIFSLLGIDGVLWRIRHIRDHHPHPNTKGHDADLDSPKFFRLAPYTEHRFYHRLQHWYAPLLYSLGTLVTIFIDDFRALKLELLRSKTSSYRSHIVRFISGKIFFISFWVALPLLLNENLDTWQVLIGLAIATIPTGWLFLPIAATHLNEHTQFYKTPSNSGFFETQLETTVDFSPKSSFITMVYGGLNCHLAHHLFPSVAACHYAAIYRRLDETFPDLAGKRRSLSIFDLLFSHFRFLALMSKDCYGGFS